MVAIFIAVQLSTMTLQNRKVIALSYLVLLSLFFFTLLIFWIKKPDFMEVSTLAIITISFTTVASYIIYYFIENNKIYKPVVMSVLFSITLLLVSTFVMKNNSQLINSTRDMMSFINTVGGKQKKTILVYNYLLTSIPLYSDANIITINSGHNTTKRDVQFQDNTLWKEHLWNAKDDTIISRLGELSHNKNTFLLVRKRHDLNGKLSFLKDDFNSTKEFSKWTIYYNQ
jgi:4-amino-4-deoxy-L-arabinose transferase